LAISHNFLYISAWIKLDMTAELSVVVATYKRAALLEGTLGALAAQEVPRALEWEIVVVDNNSQDRTAEVVDAVSKLTEIPIVYVFEPRQGVSHARNRGITEARGSIIAFIDDDILPASDWIAQVEAAMARWRADGVGGRILPHWEAPPPKWLTQRQDLMDRLGVMDHSDNRVLSYPLKGQPQVWGGNMAFRRAVFEQIGGFDHARGIVGTKLFRGEEVDLVNRALRQGLRVVYDPAILVRHRIGKARMCRAYFRRLEFDAAQGEVDTVRIGRSRTMRGVPLWLYSILLTAYLKWIALLVLRRSEAFDQQLDCARWMGRFAGHWKNSRARRVNDHSSG